MLLPRRNQMLTRSPRLPRTCLSLLIGLPLALTACTGGGAGKSVSFSPNPVSWSKAETKTVTVHNGSIEEYYFSGPVITNSSVFKLVSTDCSGKIVGGGTCEVKIKVEPYKAKEKGELIFEDGEGNASVHLETK